MFWSESVPDRLMLILVVVLNCHDVVQDTDFVDIV